MQDKLICFIHTLNHEKYTHDIMAIGKCYVTYNYNIGFRLTLFLSTPGVIYILK